MEQVGGTGKMSRREDNFGSGVKGNLEKLSHENEYQRMVLYREKSRVKNKDVAEGTKRKLWIWDRW